MTLKSASMTAINNPMLPVHMTTDRVLDDAWVWGGEALTSIEVHYVAFNGGNYLMHIGYPNQPVFLVAYPAERGAKERKAEHAEVERVAQTFMAMINLKRRTT